MSEAGSARSVGENVALQVPSHGIPIVAQGPKAITRGLRLHTELPQESSGSSLVYSAYGAVVTHPPAVYRGDHLSAVPALKTRRPWSSDQKSCHGAGASEVPSIRPSAAPFEGACARLAPPSARSASRRPGGRCGAGGSASWLDCALGARLIQVKIASLFQASGESARCRCPWSQTRNPASCCRHRRMRTRPARKEFCTDRSASP